MTQPSDAKATWWLGIDVGGTFTDFVAVNTGTGETREHKVLTTADAQEVGVLQGLREIGIPIQQIEEIVHGHTAGINAVLSRRGAHAALLATDGHRDLLDIGRMDREFGPRFYDPTWLRPHQERPIIARRDRYGITERIDYDGNELVPLDEDRVREAARQMKAEGVGSVAVCFLNAYLTDKHEQQAVEILREECPELYVQSSAVYPVTKESERTTTVALDAYVGPIVTGYLRRLEKGLTDAGFAGSLWIMTMNGGVGSVAETAKAPVFQLVSGPVGGVSGAVHAARTSDHQNLLTVDVGGTSSDVSVVRAGTTPLTDLWSVEHGLTMTMPVVDVTSVGSGAGSIIHLDSLGTLRVGPESAGSSPGPAAYGRGGERPTLTDACVALGILQPDQFAGGALKLDRAAAERALSTVSEPLGMTVAGLADGAYRLACSEIAGSIRSISTYRGVDIREFSLLAFGAAGPMVAVRVARELGVGSVVIPAGPGEYSAFGLLSSDLRSTKARSPMMTLTPDSASTLEEEFRELELTVRADLERQGVAPSRVTFERAFNAMYAGQTWDNRLPIETGELDAERIRQMITQVHEFYQARYGFSAEELPIILTTIEVSGVARRQARPRLAKETTETDPLIGRTTVLLDGVEHPETPVYQREHLPVNHAVSGPAVVVERYATTLLDAGSTAQVDEQGSLQIALR